MREELYLVYITAQVVWACYLISIIDTGGHLLVFLNTLAYQGISAIILQIGTHSLAWIQEQ